VRLPSLSDGELAAIDGTWARRSAAVSGMTLPSPGTVSQLPSVSPLAGLHRGRRWVVAFVAAAIAAGVASLRLSRS